jgi:CBS domain-containing protein
VTLDDVKKVPPERRGLTTVAQVMTPAGKLATAFPSDGAVTVLEMMEEKDAEHVPVLWEGKVVGIIAREELWRFAQIHAGY